MFYLNSVLVPLAQMILYFLNFLFNLFCVFLQVKLSVFEWLDSQETEINVTSVIDFLYNCEKNTLHYIFKSI